MIRYIYNNNKYNSLHQIRQEIFKEQRIAFGEWNEETKKQFNVTEEEYDPIDEMSDDQVASMVRRQRDSKLSETDYYMQPDYPSTPDGIEALKTYRQALRDITKQSGFPRNVEWPAVPYVLCKNKTLAKTELAKVGI
nr:MAG TPA: tail assembly chaperone protein [Caudoviricetes sp.]